MNTEIVATCKLYNRYLRSLPNLMQYRDTGLYATSDEAIVLVKNNRIVCELCLIGGQLVKIIRRRGKTDRSRTLTPDCATLNRNLSAMVQYAKS